MDVSSLVSLIGCSSGQDNSVTPKSSKVSKDKLKSDTSIMKYPLNKKSYNIRWETDPLLKTWIARHPVDDGKVVCQFCQSVIRAHKNDLLEHSRTLKHQRNFMANSSPSDYNEFVIALNDLRKDAQVMNKKRSGKSSNNTSNGGNTILALPPSLSTSASLNNNNNGSSSSTNNNNNCIINTNNNSLSSISNNNNNIMQLNSWTSITTSGVLLNNNNCKVNITNNDEGDEEEEEEEEENDGNNTAEINNDGNDVDLWSENNTYISANSPSDLVSVILEEQEQIGSPNDNSSSDCSVSLSIPTLTPIINNINNSSSISSPLHHIQQQQQQQQHHQQQQQQHTIQQTRLLKPDSASSSALLLSSVDVISAIQDNYFNLNELIEISRSALDKIGQVVNGNSISNPPSLIINDGPNIQNPQQLIINSQTRMDKISKRKAKKKSDKNLKKMKSIKTEGLNFALGLESL